MRQGHANALRSSSCGPSRTESAGRVRRFAGPWPQVCARLQLYLLEILAARPQPSGIHIRFAKALVTPDELRRDVVGLREALVRRLGADRVRCEAVDDAPGHEVRLEWARPPAAGHDDDFTLKRP